MASLVAFSVAISNNFFLSICPRPSRYSDLGRIGPQQGNGGLPRPRPRLGWELQHLFSHRKNPLNSHPRPLMIIPPRPKKMRPLNPPRNPPRIIPGYNPMLLVFRPTPGKYGLRNVDTRFGFRPLGCVLVSPNSAGMPLTLGAGKPLARAFSFSISNLLTI